MIYIYLAVALAFGGLYLHDEYEGNRADEAELKASAADTRVKTLEQSLKDEEAKREIDIGVLIDHQRTQTARINAGWKAKLAQQAKTAAAQLTELQGSIHAYITPAADTRCVVPVGALLFHDRAAVPADQSRAPLPPASGGAGDADSGLHLSDVFAVVADNYAGAQAALADASAEITAWREWYVAQKALFTGDKK